MELLKSLYSKATAESLNDRFEITKKFSDYIGMITRIVFIWAIIAFFGQYLSDNSAKMGYFSKFYLNTFYYLLILLALSFSLMFSLTTMHTIDVAFRLRSWKGMQGRIKATAYIAYSVLIAAVWTVISNAFASGLFPLVKALVESAKIAK